MTVKQGMAVAAIIAVYGTVVARTEKEA